MLAEQVNRRAERALLNEVDNSEVLELLNRDRVVPDRDDLALAVRDPVGAKGLVGDGGRVGAGRGDRAPSRSGALGQLVARSDDVHRLLKLELAVQEHEEAVNLLVDDVVCRRAAVGPVGQDGMPPLIPLEGVAAREADATVAGQVRVATLGLADSGRGRDVGEGPKVVEDLELRGECSAARVTHGVDEALLAGASADALGGGDLPKGDSATNELLHGGVLYCRGEEGRRGARSGGGGREAVA